MTSGASYAELVKRDRAVLLSAIAVLTALAWAYTARLAASMGSMDMDSMVTTMAMPSTLSWSPGDFAFMLGMWVAMMLPSATPMVLLFA